PLEMIEVAHQGGGRAGGDLSRPVGGFATLRRRAEQRRHLHEIGVERREGEFVHLCIVPGRVIVCMLQSKQAHVARTRKQILQLSAKLEAQVLIEQKLHLAVTMRRSRSAAYARQARMSSSFSSG